MSEVTPTERLEIVNERAAQKAKLREAYQRIYNNPFRTSHSIFDPAVFRYESARAYAKDFYKYTPRSILVPAVIFGLVVGLQLSVNKERSEKEAKIRNGETSYYDRARWASRGLY